MGEGVKKLVKRELEKEGTFELNFAHMVLEGKDE